MQKNNKRPYAIFGRSIEGIPYVIFPDEDVDILHLVAKSGASVVPVRAAWGPGVAEKDSEDSIYAFSNKIRDLVAEDLEISLEYKPALIKFLKMSDQTKF